MSQRWAKGSDTRWRTFRANILARDHHQCQIRGPGCTTTAPQDGGHVDHITPLHLGGDKYDPTNARAACQHCNTSRRTTLTDEPAPKHISTW